jgi:excinuclease ABC subunit B
MIREIGSCAGIENYSRHMDQRPAGSAPWTLIDYFPDDYLLIVDESHMSIPQVRGMYNGDRSRKQVLVDYGFRLPSALDNRPLTFRRVLQTAEPGDLHQRHPRPLRTAARRAGRGSGDPPHGDLRPADHRPADRGADRMTGGTHPAAGSTAGQRVLVTTLTKKMAEKLSEYLRELWI